MTVEWTTGAEAQIFEVRLEQHSERTRQHFDQALKTALEQLEAFPESGRTHPILNREDVRAILIENYRLTYVLLEDRVLVFSFVHTRSGAAFD